MSFYYYTNLRLVLQWGKTFGDKVEEDFSFMTQIDNGVEQQRMEGTEGTEGKPRLRFAPSPTGFMHIGGYRTILFSWLYARHTGGSFILRIEDTDIARTVEGAIEVLLDGMRWLDIDYDEGPLIGGLYGPYYQTQRKALYQSRLTHKGRGTQKPPVVALVERGGRIRTRVVADVTGRTLKRAIRESVRPTATIHTDELSSYKGIGRHFAGGHHTVRHSLREYALRGVHVNTAESFFSLLKRGLIGTFHAVSKRHLHRYVNEFAFRWNHRKEDDGARTVAAIRGAEGKRLRYREPRS